MKYTDKEIFLESNSIINDNIFETIFNCTYNLRYSMAQYNLVEKYKYYFLTPDEKKDTSKIFNNEFIQQDFNEFFDKFLKLFGDCQWFVSNRDDNYFEIDFTLRKIAPEEYKRVEEKIKNLSNDCSNAYKKYRTTIKENLGI